MGGAAGAEKAIPEMRTAAISVEIYADSPHCRLSNMGRSGGNLQGYACSRPRSLCQEGVERMSNQCNQCGSYAINHNHRGGDGSDPDLCDVCYWHTLDTISLRQRLSCPEKLAAAISEDCNAVANERNDLRAQPAQKVILPERAIKDGGKFN